MEENKNSNMSEVIAAYNYFVQNYDKIGSLEELAKYSVDITTSGATVDNAGLNLSKSVIKVLVATLLIAAAIFVAVKMGKSKGGQ